MSPEVIGIIGIAVLLIFIYLGMWVGLAMFFVGLWGVVAIIGFGPALTTLAIVPYRAIGDYTFAAMPLFLLMGIVVYNAGFATDLFYAAHKWMGQLRGGLAMATAAACAVLGVVTDSMVAVITLGKVAVPEMRKYQYDDSLANASVVAGASLASLIPPSVGFILYGVLVGESIGQLYIAAIIPGILLVLAMLLMIAVMVRVDPKLAAAAPRTTLREKVVSLKHVWGVGLVFILILTGIYAGVFTPTEAGAVGAFGAMVIGLVSRRLNKQNLLSSVQEVAQMTAMIVLLMAGAFLFTKLMTFSELSFMLTDFVIGLNVSRYIILAVIIVIYILLGMFCDIIASILLTLPVFFPLVTGLGFDPIWYGVVMVIVIEMGMITPPIGMSVFTLAGITGTPVNTIFRGVWPFVGLLIIFIVIITIFPQIVLFLPGTMR